jgi:hypothetical protein
MRELEQYTEHKTTEFVKELKGRYSEFLSDKFLQVYLVSSFMDSYRARPNSDLANTAYASSVLLFESLLEHGCGAIGNGHHVAQMYSAMFPQKTIQECSNELKAFIRDNKLSDIL